MPIIEARESLTNDLIFENDQDRIKVVTQKINLKSGMQRNMLQMDYFWDHLPSQIGVLPSIQSFDGVIELIVTPTPLILTSMSVDGLPRATPNAGSDNVLFKAVINSPDRPTTIQDGGRIQQRQFPQSFLATQANFPFYHPHVYISLVFHLADIDTGAYPYVSRSRISFYMSFAEKKISALKYGLGLIREFSISQVERITANGRLLSNPLNLAGQYSPMYTWGGARPEIMISGQALTQYFLSQSGQEAETMNTSAQLRTFAAQSRTMVPNPEAFGDAAAGMPYWIRDLLPLGVIAGAIRPQRPPRVTQDDPTLPGLGNVVCV